MPLQAGQHRSASERPFRRDDDGPTLNAGLVALHFFRGSIPVLLRNPIFFLIFRGGGGGADPLSPPLDPHMTLTVTTFNESRFIT